MIEPDLGFVLTAAWLFNAVAIAGVLVGIVGGRQQRRADEEG